MSTSVCQDESPIEHASSDVKLTSYFPALDGLRFFCCVAVVVAHCFHDAGIIQDTTHPLHHFAAGIGATGVDIFFALSGFLITKLLLDEISNNGRVDLRRFYIRRMLRIFPVYYTALFMGFALSGIVGERFNRPLAYVPDGNLYTHALPVYLAFLGNWFSTIPVPSPLVILWSVCVEEQFYILFPVTFAFSQRRYPALVPIGIGLLLAWSVRIYLAVNNTPGSIIYRNTFAHGDHLLMGGLLAQLFHISPSLVVRLVRAGGLIAQFAAIAACFAYTALDPEFHSTPIRWWLSYIVSALIATSIVALFAFGTGIGVDLLSRKAVRFLGGLTYAGYTFHMYAVTVGWFLASHFGLTIWSEACLRSVFAIPITFLLAYISKVAIENRFMLMKDRYQPRSQSRTL